MSETVKTLRKISRRLLPREKATLKAIRRRRPDLNSVSNVPIKVVPRGELQRRTGYIGWHHWEAHPKPHTVEIFIEEPYFQHIVLHELCHAKVLQRNPNYYAQLTPEQRERLAENCATY